MNNQKDNPTLNQAVLPPMIMCLAMWVVYKIDIAYGSSFFIYGIFPRTLHGLTGIVTTPLLHDTETVYHIFENTIALLFFGSLLFYFYHRIAWRIVLWSWILNGLMVWLMAKPVYHIGMSGVIYALAFFLMTVGMIRRERQLAGMVFLIIFLYGSIFWGLFPVIPKVSWESHTAGAITGVLLGFIFRNVSPAHVPPQKPIEDDPADDEPDAWWKTGVLNEKTEETNKDITIRYEYKPQQRDTEK